jgi:hypothetical protein
VHGSEPKAQSLLQRKTPAGTQNRTQTVNNELSLFIANQLEGIASVFLRIRWATAHILQTESERQRGKRVAAQKT